MGRPERTPASSLGQVRFDAKTSDFYRESIEFPFFEHHLKGTPDPKLPEAFVFQTGSNQWKRLDAWPPKSARPGRSGPRIADGKLGLDATAEPDGEGFDEYVSDPAKPVPSNPNIAIGMTREYMVDDQRFAARRPDVLVYQTEPLETEVTLAGPVMPELIVSTTGTDSDWVVKLIDVYPDDYPDPDPNPTGVKMGGFQQLVRGDVMRGKFRDSFETPKPFEPGKPTAVRMKMNDVYHTFRPGHRIMVQVQSQLVPAGRPQPPDVRRHLPGQARATSARRPSASIAPKGSSSKLEVLVEP